MLKKFFILLYGVYALVKAEHIPFTNFGYSDIVLYGPSPIATLFLKVGQNVDPSSSYIVLNLDISPVLDVKNSFLTFIVWDKPVLSVRLGQVGRQVVIPLSKVDLSFSNYIKLEIKGFLRITDDRCKDLQSNGLYVTIERTSYVEVRYSAVEKKKIGIWNYFDYVRGKIFIVIPESLSPTEVEGCLWIYSFLRKNTGAEFKIATFKTLPDTVTSFVIISRFDKIPGKYRSLIAGSFLKDDGLIYLFSGSIEIGDLDRRILFITGFSDEGLGKALKAFLNPDIVFSSFGSILLVRDAVELPRAKPAVSSFKLSFKELGFSSARLEGIGNLGINYTFKVSDFGSLPGELTVNISAVHSPVLKEMERAFFNVYFNDILLESRRLSEEGKVNYKFTVNRFNLMKVNTIRIEFVFYPTSEECKNAMFNFFCKVDDDNSYIEVKESYKPEELNFQYFPGIFGYGETICILGRRITLEKIESLARIVYTINSGIKSFYFYPSVIYSDLADESILRDYNIIGILDPDDNLFDRFEGVPVKPKRDFRIISSATKRVLYTLQDTTSVGIVQIFYGRGNNAVLLITGTGIYLDERMLDASRAIESKYGVISGNVGIVDYEKEYFFKIESKLLKVQYAGEKTFMDYFNQYKVFVIGFVWFLVIALFAYIFIRGRQHARRVTEKG